jgi:hypothetical protein
MWYIDLAVTIRIEQRHELVQLCLNFRFRHLHGFESGPDRSIRPLDCLHTRPVIVLYRGGKLRVVESDRTILTLRQKPLYFLGQVGGRVRNDHAIFMIEADGDLQVFPAASVVSEKGAYGILGVLGAVSVWQRLYIHTHI